MPATTISNTIATLHLSLNTLRNPFFAGFKNLFNLQLICPLTGHPRLFTDTDNASDVSCNYFFFFTWD